MALDNLTLATLGFLVTLVYATAHVHASNVVEVRSAFMCEECTFRKCPVPMDKCELVREPGICSCCLTCARKEGEFCGINLGRCGRGLKCRPKPGDPNPLLALLQDTAICQSRTRKASIEDILKAGKQF